MIPFPVGMAISSTCIALTSFYVRRRIFNAKQNRMTRHHLEVKLLKPFTFNFKQQLELEENQKEELHYTKHLNFTFRLNPSVVNESDISHTFQVYRLYH